MKSLLTYEKNGLFSYKKKYVYCGPFGWIPFFFVKTWEQNIKYMRQKDIFVDLSSITNLLALIVYYRQMGQFIQHITILKNISNVKYKCKYFNNQIKKWRKIKIINSFQVKYFIHRFTIYLTLLYKLGKL